jgi:hypothetical protein
MLERRQARRRGEAVPAPVEVAITGEVEGLAAVEALEERRDATLAALRETENFHTKPISSIESAALPTGNTGES